MKRDYYSDIKLAQRIIFENTAYLLTMLDKKVDSFTSLKTPNMRARERNDLLHPDNVLHPQAPRAIQNPLASLANDLTKPVWNCSTRAEPVAVSLLPQVASNDLQKMVNLFNYAMNRFLERYKCEHEDEASLKLHINLVDRLTQINGLINQFNQKKTNNTQQLLQDLFKTLIRAYQRKTKPPYMDHMQQDQSTELVAILQILQKLTIKNPQTLSYLHPQLVAEVCSFTQLIEGYIKSVAQSFSGPVYINYYLQADKLPLLLHPMMLAIYCCIKNQIATQEQGKQQSLPNNPNMQIPLNSQLPIFQQLKSGNNCSKITFINLDGHESNLNLTLAKHLGKYLQYISFPQDELALVQSDPKLKSYFRWRSQMLAKQYLACQASLQNIHSLFRFRQFSIPQSFEQLYKRLIVVPVKSAYIAQKKQKPDVVFPSVAGYQSYFLSFIMKEIVYNQVRQFGPSVIIVSHANTLGIMPHHLQEMFAQLSVLTNMKIIFYNNITHNLLPHNLVYEAKDKFTNFHKEYFSRQQNWAIPLSPFNKIQSFPLSVDMLERASIFFKICSGTANLSFQARQKEEKYQNSRILGYASIIMRQVCLRHPLLAKYDIRFFQYLKIDKLFSHYYQPKAISAYHKNILSSVQTVTRQYYGETMISSQQWKSFSDQYALRLNKQKQNEQSKYFTKFASTRNQGPNESSYNLIALEFQILQNQNRKLITLSNDNQILISKSKKYQTCPIFLLNHLYGLKSQTLCNYYGFVTQALETTCQARIILQELYFQQNLYNLSPYQHFTQFNYHQTQNSVILFWPLLYDTRQALVHTFSRTTYHPQITSLFFVGLKSNLAVLSHVQPANQSYRYLHPRIGCTCYQPSQSNSIYVFGGFYTDISNYLDFQTDISVIKLDNQAITIDNIPKAFFMNQQYRSDLSYSKVTSINNDFVRPRVQYEVYQLQSDETSFKQILLLGGVGEKFTRPFSLIGYMANLLRFQSGSLTKIDRIKLNNIIPVNLSRPIKQRASTQLPVIKIAQNKRIYATSTQVHPGLLTFAHFKLKYISEDPNLDKKCVGKHMSRNRRMTYNKNYEVGLEQKWIELEQQKENFNTATIRQGNETKTIKWALRDYCFKQNNQANVLLTKELRRREVLALTFTLQDDAAERLVNLQGNVIKLDPQHIIATDTFFLQTFVLFTHPQFTEGLTVLARSNVKSINELIDNDLQQLTLNEIYCFDAVPSNHIIKAVEGQQVALLHGFQFSSTFFEEYLITRIGSYYTKVQIQSSGFIKQIMQTVLVSNRLNRPNKKSFIFGSGHRLICLSFLTVERLSIKSERVFVIIEQLLLNEQTLKWRIKSCSDLRFELQLQQHMLYQTQKQHELIPKQILDVYQLSESRDLFIVLGFQNYVFQGSINIENFPKTSVLHFKPIIIQNEENQLETRLALVENYQIQRTKDRQNSHHLYAKCIDKGVPLVKNGRQIMSQESLR